MFEKDHSTYIELCALSTSGTLSSHEWKELRGHLARCQDCRERIADYRRIAREGMSSLAARQAADNLQTAHGLDERTKKQLLSRLRDQIRNDRDSGKAFLPPQNGSSNSAAIHVLWPAGGRAVPRASQFARRLLPQAAMVLLASGLALSSYWYGAHRATQESASTLVKQIHELFWQRESLNTKLAASGTAINQLSERLQQETEEIARLREREQNTGAVDAHNDQMPSKSRQELEALRAHIASAESERDLLHRELSQMETALAETKADLDALRQQRAGELRADVTLETRIEQMSEELRQRDETLQRQQQFLSSDRDIRELMGARDLYIADVFDVDGNGKTQKPFGRVFYTKGKSLIFYAFDLDRLQKPHQVSTFQAWARRGQASEVPLNLGIFYLDNETNKRWVLRFDDAKALADIQSVFVTVEPEGGSSRPSGKQLLYAYLRSIPNHP